MVQAEWFAAAAAAASFSTVGFGHVTVLSQHVDPIGGTTHTLVDADCDGFRCHIDVVERGARWDVAEVRPASFSRSSRGAGAATAEGDAYLSPPHEVATSMLACIVARLACEPRPATRLTMLSDRVSRSRTSTRTVSVLSQVRRLRDVFCLPSVPLTRFASPADYGTPRRPGCWA